MLGVEQFGRLRVLVDQRRPDLGIVLDALRSGGRLRGGSSTKTCGSMAFGCLVSAEAVC